MVSSPRRRAAGVVQDRRAGAGFVPLTDDWEFVREVLRERNRTSEHAQALRAVALVATVMAESLEGNGDAYSKDRNEDLGIPWGEDHVPQGPTNYRIQR